MAEREKVTLSRWRAMQISVPSDQLPVPRLAGTSPWTSSGELWMTLFTLVLSLWRFPPHARLESLIFLSISMRKSKGLVQYVMPRGVPGSEEKVGSCCAGSVKPLVWGGSPAAGEGPMAKVGGLLDSGNLDIGHSTLEIDKDGGPGTDVRGKFEIRHPKFKIGKGICPQGGDHVSRYVHPDLQG